MESPEAYVEWIKDVFIDLSDMIAEHAQDRTDEVYPAIAEAVEADVSEDGRLTYDDTALMGASRRPTGASWLVRAND